MNRKTVRMFQDSFFRTRHLLPGLLIMLILAPGRSLRSQSHHLIWPTDASRVMNSSFGEYRPGHFHLGLDIKTWGREGYRIFALDSGWVSRITTSPYGYGRCVFLTLHSGETVVYAHLSRFASRLVPLVAEAQESNLRYSVDLRLPDNLLKVAAGEVLGYTGSTGNGVPHLHFEIRDPQGRVVNPLLYGFPILDSRPPYQEALALIPLTGGSRVNGDVIPQVENILYDGKGRFRLPAPLTFQGYVGVALSAFDQADGAWNKFSPYEITLFIDSLLVYSERYNSLSMDEEGQVEVDRDYWLRAEGYGTFHRLFRSPRNTLPICRPLTREAGQLISGTEAVPRFLDSGSLLLPPGRHRLTLITTDFFGNESVLSGTLLAQSIDSTVDLTAVPDPSPAEAREDSLEESPLLSWKIYRRTIRFSVPAALEQRGTPRLTLWRPPWQEMEIPLRRLGDGELSGSYIWRDGDGWLTAALIINKENRTEVLQVDTLRIFSITPEEGGALISPDGLCRLVLPPGAVESPLIAGVRQRSDGFADPRPNYEFFPNSAFLYHRGTLSLQTYEPGSRGPGAGLYRLSSDSDSSFLALLEEDGRAITRIGRLGTFTILQDTIPPKVVDIQPPDGARLGAGPVSIEVEYSDDLSGLGGEDDYLILLDGKRYVVELLAQKRRLKVLLRQPLVPGEHRITVALRDRSGNRSVTRSTFTTRN